MHVFTKVDLFSHSFILFVIGKCDDGRWITFPDGFSGIEAFLCLIIARA
uniref:Uncharacterized protein n=1 Tax=Rhizophora mucronata TaxID=61149 RepID=A0A2P2QCB8_RHIMU